MSIAEELIPGSHGQSQEHVVIAGEVLLKCPFPWVSTLVHVCRRWCVCGWADTCVYVCMYLHVCVGKCACLCLGMHVHVFVA